MENINYILRKSNEYEQMKALKEDAINDIECTEKALDDPKIDWMTRKEFEEDIREDNRTIERLNPQIERLEREIELFEPIKEKILKTSNIYLDCDGVILNSNDKLDEMRIMAGFEEKTEENYLKYFEYANKHPEEWEHIINDAEPINGSIEIIKKLEELERKVFILTKVNSLKEMELKVRVLKEKMGLKVDILFVPPYIDKIVLVNPVNNILVDDSVSNVRKWNEAGGQAVLFDKYKRDFEKDKVKSLKFLL